DEDLVAFGRHAHAVDVTRDQRHAQRLLEAANTVAKRIYREADMIRSRTKALAAHQFEKQVCVLPVQHRPGLGLNRLFARELDRLFTCENGPFTHRPHTYQPPCPKTYTKLAVG